jgi:hypothetical protein
MDLKYFLKIFLQSENDIPVFRHSGVPAFRCSGIQVFRHSGIPSFTTCRVRRPIIFAQKKTLYGAL